MVTADAKELKNRLDRYLQLVRQGQPVRIMVHGKPIGCILPVGKPSESTELAQLSRLLAAGLTLGRGNLRRRWKPAAFKPGSSIAELDSGTVESIVRANSPWITTSRVTYAEILSVLARGCWRQASRSGRSR